MHTQTHPLTAWFFQNPSLKKRLIFLLLFFMMFSWIVTALAVYFDAEHEVEEIFDAQLVQSAQLVLIQSDSMLSKKTLYLSTTGHLHAYQQHVAFQVWDAQGRLKIHSIYLPEKKLAQKLGFSNIELNKMSWRVFVIWDQSHQYQIQVAQNTVFRDELATKIIWRMISPILIFTPLLAMMIWVSVNHGLRSVYNIAEAVREQAPSSLEPICFKEPIPVELKPMINALNDLFARLKTAFESERRFTADAAHELRTPLATVKTQIQVTLKMRNPIEQTQSLKKVLLSVDHAAHLVEQLLTLARLDPHEQLDLRHYPPVNLVTLTQDVIGSQIHDAIAKNQEIELNYQANLLESLSVQGDATMLKVLFRNFIDNAIRYTPENSMISISITKNHAQTGCIWEITDSGAGIPPEEAEKIFQRFYRILGTKASGSGLGLSIAKRIASLHQAELILQNVQDLLPQEGKTGLKIMLLFPYLH